MSVRTNSLSGAQFYDYSTLFEHIRNKRSIKNISVPGRKQVWIPLLEQLDYTKDYKFLFVIAPQISGFQHLF